MLLPARRSVCWMTAGFSEIANLFGIEHIFAEVWHEVSCGCRLQVYRCGGEEGRELLLVLPSTSASFSGKWTSWSSGSSSLNWDPGGAGGRIIATKDLHALLPRTGDCVRLHSKEDFADVPKFLDLEMRTPSWIIYNPYINEPLKARILLWVEAMG